jgi:predicted nucleotidyltransferase
MDKREDIIEIVKKYSAMVRKSDFPMPIEAVYLYGSYAKGTANKHSDIDVAFIVNHFEGDFFEVIPPIWKLTRNVDMRIEPKVVAKDTDFTGFIDEIEREHFPLRLKVSSWVDLFYWFVRNLWQKGLSGLKLRYLRSLFFDKILMLYVFSWGRVLQISFAMRLQIRKSVELCLQHN